MLLFNDLTKEKNLHTFGTWCIPSIVQGRFIFFSLKGHGQKLERNSLLQVTHHIDNASIITIKMIQATINTKQGVGCY